MILTFTVLKRIFKPVQPWICLSWSFTWRGTVKTSLSESTCENVNLSNIQLRNVRGVVWISLADFFCQHCHSFPTYKIKVGWGKLSIYHIWEMALQQAWRNYLCGWEIFFFAKMVVWRAYIANISIRQATSTTSANYQPELQQDAKQTLEKLRLKSIFRPLPIETFFLLPCFLVILWTYFWRNKKLA